MTSTLAAPTDLGRLVEQARHAAATIGSPNAADVVTRGTAFRTHRKACEALTAMGRHDLAVLLLDERRALAVLRAALDTEQAAGAGSFNAADLTDAIAEAHTIRCQITAELAA